MIYGFDTEDEHAATAALVLYVVWRSRDRARFKITPDVWGRVEQFTKDAAKRARSIPDFIEALKKPGRLNAPTLHPRFMEVRLRGEAPTITVVNADGSFQSQVRFDTDRETGLREFGTQVFERADAAAAIKAAYRNTAWIVLLVRDRIEREKPIEHHIETIIEEEV